MSVDPGYMLIRVELQGARQAAAEAQVVRGAVTETAAATQASNAATAQSGRTASKAGKAWSAAGKVAKLGALGIAGAVGALGIAGQKALEKTSDLALTSNVLRKYFRISADESTQLGGVLQSLGVDAKGATMAFGTLSKQTTAALADPGGTSADIFDKLGISRNQLKNSRRDFSGFIKEISGGLEGLGRKGDKLSVMRTLFGRGAGSMGVLFRDGRKGFNDMTSAADKFGVTMSGDALDAQIEYIKTQRESMIATQGLQIMLADELRPAFTDVHMAYQDFVKEMADAAPEDRIDVLREHVEDLSDFFGKKLVDVATIAVEQFGEAGPGFAVAFIRGFLNANAWGKLFAGAWLINKLLTSSAKGRVAAGAASLGSRMGRAIYQKVWLWMAGTSAGSSLLGMFSPTGKLGAKLKGPASALGRSMGKWMGRGLVVGFLLALPLLIPEAFNFFESFGEKMKPAIYKITYFIGSIFRDVLNGIIRSLNNVIGAFNKLPGPDIGEIGEIEANQPGVTVTAPTTGATGINPALLPGGGKKPPSVADITGGGGGKKPKKRLLTPSVPGRKLAAGFAGGGETIEPADVVLDGEKVGTIIFRRAKKKGARK
jgi:hypothetical protein